MAIELCVLTNWTPAHAVPENWHRLLPSKSHFQLCSYEDAVKEGKQRAFVVLNGTRVFDPWHMPHPGVFLTMEPRGYRSLVPLPWRPLTSSLGRNNLEWHVSKSFDQLNAPIDPASKNAKPVKLSVIVSGLSILPGHRKRLDFVAYLDKQWREEIPMDVYGYANPRGLQSYRGKLPPYCKDAGLFPYMFHLCIENSEQKGYFTEKLCDPLLAGCVPFYFGCPDVSQYVDARAMITLDLTDFETSAKLIAANLSRDNYLMKLPFVQRERLRLLRLTSAIPTIDRLLVNRQLPAQTSIYVWVADDDHDTWLAWTSSCQKVGVEKYERLEPPPEESAQHGFYARDRKLWKQWLQQDPLMEDLLPPRVKQSVPPLLIVMGDGLVWNPDAYTQWLKGVKALQMSPEPGILVPRKEEERAHACYAVNFSGVKALVESSSKLSWQECSGWVHPKDTRKMR